MGVGVTGAEAGAGAMGVLPLVEGAMMTLTTEPPRVAEDICTVAVRAPLV